MRTERQLERISSEFIAIDNACYRPGQDTWKSYCRALSNKLNDELIHLDRHEKILK